MTDTVKYEWVSPVEWREYLNQLEARGSRMEIASARIVLQAVENGDTIITGDHGGTIYFTSAGPKEAPWE
jgi:hypothetical protein